MIYKFTSRAKKAIELAQDEAINLGHNYIGTEHILYGLVREGAGVASKVLQNQGVTPNDVENKIVDMIGKEVITSQETLGFTPRSKRVIEKSGFRFVKENTQIARDGHEYISLYYVLDNPLKKN